MPGAALYSSLAGDPVLGEIVAQFVAEMPERIAHLEALAASGNQAELARFAHQMKGAGGSYGFDPITSAAARLETLLKQGGEAAETAAALAALLEVCRSVT